MQASNQDKRHDKRSAPRQTLFAPVQYKYEGMRRTEQGVIANISASGMLLWTAQSLSPEKPVHVWLESAASHLPPIQLRTEVVRREKTPDAQFSFGYGCRIIDQ